VSAGTTPEATNDPSDAAPDDVDTGADTARGNRIEASELLLRLHSLSGDDPERSRVRDRLVELHMPLVKHLARRFAGRNEPLPDLLQVATIGLLKSIDRFDVERGLEFSTYATPTSLGEIKRHFRDYGWLLRVPRRAQELQAAIAAARADLAQELHRAPTVSELSERIGASIDDVIEALDVARGYVGVPLTTLSADGGDLADNPIVGIDDEGLQLVEARALLGPMLAKLPERERRILLLRFVDGKTQTEIAEVVGISQMQVSRLVARSLTQLRDQLNQA
jgi:RNA polymerase sigma-B factor